MPFQSECVFVAPSLLQGYVFLDAQPDLVLYLGLFVNDQFKGSVVADLPGSHDEFAENPADGHGFAFNLNLAALAETDLVCIRALNTQHVVIQGLFGDLRKTQSAPTVDVAMVDVVQGLTLSGRLENGITDLPSYEIIAMEGDTVVGRSRVWRWQHIGDPQDPMGKTLAFDLLLDPRLADGHLHVIRVETSTGQAIAGSPAEVIAWPNHMRAVLKQRGSASTPSHARKLDMMQDRILGISMPLSGYAALYPSAEISCLPMDPVGTIGSDGKWFHLGQSGWVLFCHRDLRPLPDFTDRFLNAVSDFVAARAVFCDLAIEEVDGSIWPLLMPAFDWERLLEQGTSALCFALPKAALDSKAASLAELLLGWLWAEGGPPDRTLLWHIPHPGAIGTAVALVASCIARTDALAAALAQPNRLPIGTTVAPVQKPGAQFPALRISRPVTDRAVSVIVPTCNQGTLLQSAVNSMIAQNPGFDLDILIVDNRSDDPNTLDVLNKLEDGGARILEFGEGFNFSLINNLASEYARHDQLCFMNNDVNFEWPVVLEELCSRLACPTTGAVGPLMVRASDIVQHGGVVLGPWAGAMHAFDDRMLGDPGYADLLCSASEPGALTGAMLLTRRTLFEQLGGFDTTRFAVNFNDVDYCMRLRAAGYRVVFSPHACIRHFESVSRGRERATPAGLRMQRELASLRLIWGESLRNDTQYHPLFSLDGQSYSSLSFDHRAPAPRNAVVHQALSLPRWV